MMTLADMIAVIRGDRPFRELAEKSGLSVPTWDKFEKGRNSDFPAADSIAGFAKGLQVSQREIIIAAAVGLGFNMDDDSSQLGRMLPKAVDQLSEHSKKALLDLAETLVKAEIGDAAQQAKAVAAQAKAVRKSIDSAKTRLQK